MYHAVEFPTALVLGMLGMLGVLGFPRLGGGFLGATVASVASHVHLAVGEIGVNLARHDDHLARNFLVRFFVAGEVVLHVAEVAANAQRHPERLHGLHQVLGL